jgi:hypothetical protein
MFLISCHLFPGPAEPVNEDDIDAFLYDHDEVLELLSGYQYDYSLYLHEKPKVMTSPYHTCDFYNDGPYFGWDFCQLPVLVIMDACEELTEFVGIVLIPEAEGQLDKCPVYIFIKSFGGEYSIKFGAGNFRRYMRQIAIELIEFVSNTELDEGEAQIALQAAHSMTKDLHKFSTEAIKPTAKLTVQCFRERMILM